MTDLTMRVSELTCLDALHGSLSQTSAGAVMHVAIGKGRKARTVRTMTAPVDAWLAFEGWCRAEARILSGDGYTANQRAVRLRRAADRIATEFDRLAKHPAYRGIAVAGAQRRAPPRLPHGPGALVADAPARPHGWGRVHRRAGGRRAGALRGEDRGPGVHRVGDQPTGIVKPWRWPESDMPSIRSSGTATCSS